MAGIAMIAVEVVVLGSASCGLLLFGSLGALMTGVLLWHSVIPDELVSSASCFALTTVLSAFVLGRPLQRLQGNVALGNDRSSDLIGYSFVLSSDLAPGNPATQKYSGIFWRVELSADTAETSVPMGAQVSVTAVGSGVFYVAPA